jgi:hypothetical protein
MNKKHIIQRYDLVGEYDLSMAPIEDGDYVKFDDIKSYIEVIKKIREWAQEKVNCSHELCSLEEGCYEEKFGQEILDILDGKSK